MSDFVDIALRIGAAALIGIVIGFDRDARDKAAGISTLGLVAISAALVTIAGESYVVFATALDAKSRLLQGLVQGTLAGIGFIGAGAILKRGHSEDRIHGVTTAATVLIAAAFGIACGLGAWVPVFVAFVFVFIVIYVAKPLGARFIARVEAAEKALETEEEPMDRR